MNAWNFIILLLSAALLVFGETKIQWARQWLGVQPDWLPILAVYAGLSMDMLMAGLLALAMGLFFDSLSANPLGISCLPLILLSTLAYGCRELLVRQQLLAQMLLGAIACSLASWLVWLGLNIVIPLRSEPVEMPSALSSSIETGFPAYLAPLMPLTGWPLLWQGLVLATLGAIASPVFFFIFDRLFLALNHPVAHRSSFRNDREIVRGRYS